MPLIVALAGAGEYQPHLTLPDVARRIAQATGAELEFRASDIVGDVPDSPLSTFGDLTPLASADLLVLAIRWRNLGESEIAQIARYLESGGPLLALRTSNHGFRQSPDSAYFRWAETFPTRYVGSPWIRHHGHSSRTSVHRVAQSEVLLGVPDEFTVSSWLYVTRPPTSARVLLFGHPIEPETSPEPSPVAWTRQRGRQRIFYTSLGSEQDLSQPEVLTLVENAGRWCMRSD